MNGKKGKIKEIMHAKSGQALIAILLVMAISLTLGVSVATRTISTLRQLTFSEQSADALAYAEAGVEEALQQRCSATGGCTNGTYSVNLTGATNATYTISALSAANLPEIDKDSTLEVSLSGHSGAVSVCWSSLAANPAITGNYITQQGVTYRFTRRSFDPSSTRRASNGFSNPVKPAACSAYQYGASFPAGVGTPRVIRLRSLYAGPISIAAPNVSANQGNLIVSTGSSGQVKRRVEVRRTFPAISGLFDHAVFSGSTTQPLSR